MRHVITRFLVLGVALIFANIGYSQIYQSELEEYQDHYILTLMAYPTVGDINTSSDIPVRTAYHVNFHPGNIITDSPMASENELNIKEQFVLSWVRMLKNSTEISELRGFLLDSQLDAKLNDPDQLNRNNSLLIRRGEMAQEIDSYQLLAEIYYGSLEVLLIEVHSESNAKLNNSILTIFTKNEGNEIYWVESLENDSTALDFLGGELVNRLVNIAKTRIQANPPVVGL